MENEEIGCSGSCATCGGCGTLSDDVVSTIVLTDEEDGREVEFDILDEVTLEDGRTFLIASEAKEEQSEEIEIIILEVKNENNEEVFESLSDEKLAREVYSIFLKKNGIEEESE